MNQAILFNDDIHFDPKRKCWVFTGLLNGERLTVIIDQKNHGKELFISDCVKFDWEEAVEIWLEKYEPDQNNEIYLKF